MFKLRFMLKIFYIKDTFNVEVMFNVEDMSNNKDTLKIRSKFHFDHFEDLFHATFYIGMVLRLNMHVHSEHMIIHACSYMFVYV